MNEPVKLLFDENTGAPFVDVLRKIAVMDRRRPCEIAHTIERFGKAAKDPDWIPKIVSEKWLVVSEDRGRNSSHEERLPYLCLKNSVTHVLVMPALLITGGQFEKMRALLAIWPDLFDLANAPAGTRAKLKYSGPSKSGFRLDRVTFN